MSPRALPNGRQVWLGDVLADAFRGVSGFQFDVIAGWQTRGASYATYSSGRVYFNPRGFMNHHTGRGSYVNLLHYMTFNSSIAPLANVATSRPHNGIVRVTLCAAGRANHAGRGFLPWTGTNMGNWRTLGGEHQNDGTQDWPAQQNEAIARLNAACLAYMEHDVDRLVDHKTYAPGRKSDRVHIDINAWREFVKSHRLEEAIMLSKGDSGSYVKRLQKEINLVLTAKAFGVTGMSVLPKDGVGLALDGDYGPNTADGLKQAMAVDGHTISGEVCGANEWTVLAILHAYYDSQKHIREQSHSAGDGAVDLTPYATKTQVKSVAAEVAKVRTAHNDHRHAEGTTGLPNVKA